MILDGEKNVEMKVEGTKFEQMMSFKYFGVQIQNNEKQETEINERIGTAMKIYYTLNRNVLRMREITEKIKVNVHKAIFYPNLAHGCDSWELTKDTRNRI